MTRKFGGRLVLFLRAKGFNFSAEGADPLAAEKASEWFGRLPVGVKADKRFMLTDGFCKVGADASLTPQFGRHLVSRLVEGTRIEESLGDDWLASLKANAVYEGRRSSFKVEYGMTKGNLRRFSHSVSLKANLIF